MIRPQSRRTGESGGVAWAAVILQLLEIVAISLPMWAIIGFGTWLGFRGWPARKRYLHARTLAARENVRRVREQQERLWEQQQRQNPYGSGRP